MKSVLSALILTAGIMAGFAPSAYADEPKLEGTYSDWMVYTKGSGSNQICYALATPKSKSPTNVNHGDVFFMVANWKSGAAAEQPSLMTGYSLKVSAPPNARVGSVKTTMYASQNEAFVEDTSAEKRLVKNMRGGSLMRIDAVSTRGTATGYEFSLAGITAALKKAKSVCS